MWNYIVSKYFIDKKRNLMTFIWFLEKMYLGYFLFYKGDLNLNMVYKGILKF